MEEFEEFEEAVDRVSALIRGMAAGEIHPEDIDKELGISNSERMKTELNQPKRKPNVFNDKPSGNWDLQGSNMSQEAFMRVVEEDAKRRATERKERNLKSDDLKNRGNDAYRQGDFQQALSCFNQMRFNVTLFLVVTLLCFQAANSGPLTYAICQAGCAAVAVACFSAAGVTFGTVPGAVIAASPALAACNTAYAGCYTMCSPLIIVPTP